jgi:hypothetical protein
VLTNVHTSGRVFIVGAGFSKYLSGGRFPLLKELGDDLVSSLPWMKTYCDKYGTLDVERALTDLDLDLLAAGGDRRDALVARRQEIIAFVGNRLSPDTLTLADLQEQVKQVLAIFQPGDYILTFNWDCLLETILLTNNVWKPYDGYGWSLSIPQDSDGGKAFNPFFITLLKLHGSLNFLQALDGTRHIVVRRFDSQTSENDIFPVVTLPTYVKHFGDEYDLVEIWREAVEAIGKARVVVVIGYSLPRADAMARLLFSFAGKESLLKHVAIVNWSIHDCEHIRRELRNLATLPMEIGSYDDTVEWRLLPAHSGSAYRELHQTLIGWPCTEITAQIAERAAFPRYLGFVTMLNSGSRKRD